MHVSPVGSAVSRLAVLLAGLLLAANATAQGTGGHLPDPADSRSLTRRLERFVSPSVSQWREIEGVHEAYLGRFDELRDRDIQRFLAFARTAMTGIPDARTAREYLKRLATVRGRISDEDARLFAAIGEVLEESQLPGLSEVRLARERDVLLTGLADADRSEVMDLWSLLEDWERGSESSS